MDALHVLNLVTAVVASTARFADLVVVTEAGDQRTFKFPPGAGR